MSDCGIYGQDGEYTEKTKRDQEAYEEQLKNGYSAPHENPSVSAYYGIPGFFPVVDDVGLSKSKGVNYTLSIFASTYNLLASFGNVMIGGASEAYSLIDVGFEYVFGLNLDEAANTLMANGMLAPAGIMLDSFNTYMEYMKLTTSSNMLKTGIDIGKTSVDVIASSVGINARPPVEGFDKWLNKGPANNQVYFGIVDGIPEYTGISRQKLNKRLYQYRANGNNFDFLDPQYFNLTRNQARTIEQYLIEKGPSKMNKINSISPNNKYYQDTMNWAKDFPGVN